MRVTRTLHDVLSAAGLAAVVLAPFSAQALPERAPVSSTDLLARLRDTAGGELTLNQLPESLYTTLHAKGSDIISADNVGQAPEERARFFLSIYGNLLGVKDSVEEFSAQRISLDRAGNTHVHLDQIYQGLPVFGARVIVHMNGHGITGTNGVFIPIEEGFSIKPALDESAIRARGLAAAHRLHPKSALAVESTRLMIYRTGLLKGVSTQKNYLVYEVMVKGATHEAVREQLIFDANTGAILNRIDRIETVLNREIHTPTIDTMPVLTEGSVLAPADPAFAGDTKGNPASSRTHGPGTVPTDNLYIYAGGTYKMYENLFGVGGYDFTRPAMPQIQKSVYLVNDQCPNAYWDGTSTNYCPGFDADDVVSHEWSHAYTEYTDNLVYQYQSGALNESNSDIFGETYDLIDGFEGPLGATLTEGDYYENAGSRWVVGEDLSEAAAALLLRDMWDPDAFPTPSPGSTITSENYECGTSDNGGVHTNSGVSNHAYAMLVDGKTFNGYTVPGIGLTKAAHIYFQAKTHYGTPTQNFPQHADGLEQGCADLVGVPLNDVFGAVSDQVVTKADCEAVHTVTLAVEFRGKPGGTPATVAEKCNYIPVLKPEASTPALCGSGLYVTPTFRESFEASSDLPAGWTQGENLTGDLDIAPWTTSTDLPAPHTGRAAFFKNDTGGTCTTGGDESASHYLDTPEITVQTAADFYTFTHFMQSESGFDGGNLKYSVNGGAFAIVPAAAFTYNGHSGVFGDAPLLPGVPDPVGIPGNGNNTSPNAGEVAWTGSDQGEATGSWGTTIVDLSKLTTAAKAGDKIRFRYDFANDGCGGNLGWFVDNVEGFYCATTPPPNTAPTAILTLDKDSGTAPLTVQITRGGSDADSGDKVVSYSINYGDGATDSDVTYASAGSSSSATAPHTFQNAGTYTVSLTVKDSFGLKSAAVTKTVTVSPAATTTGGSSGGTTSGGGTTGGTTTGIPTLPGTPVTTDAERGNGGAFPFAILAPLFGLGTLRLRRRRDRRS